jgi:hypothetical protein
MTDWLIPDESDQISRPTAQRPERPKLQRNHDDLSEVVHLLLHRIEELEERVKRLEEGTEFFEEVVDTDKE